MLAARISDYCSTAVLLGGGEVSVIQETKPIGDPEPGPKILNERGEAVGADINHIVRLEVKIGLGSVKNGIQIDPDKRFARRTNPAD